MQDAPPLAVTLDNGQTLRFRVKIDRVDQGPDGSMFVSDYKTGKGRDFKGLGTAEDPTKAGTLLQLGLYAEAVADQLGANSVASHYWMVNTEVGHVRQGYRWTEDRRDHLTRVLSAISEGVETGVFAATPGDYESHFGTYKNCKFCEFDSVCPKDRAEHASDKADAPLLQIRSRLHPQPDPEGVG